jgi:hypothetical protein
MNSRMTPKAVTAAALQRRELRWAKERAEKEEREAGKKLAAEIAAWRNTKPENLTFSNMMCRKAPADLGCVYIKSWNPLRNPCLFCCGMEEDIF